MTDQASWSIARGGEKGEVTHSVNSVTAPGADVRLTFEDTLTREELILGLLVIEQAVLETPWPPAP